MPDKTKNYFQTNDHFERVCESWKLECVTFILSGKYKFDMAIQR